GGSPARVSLGGRDLSGLELAVEQHGGLRTVRDRHHQQQLAVGEWKGRLDQEARHPTGERKRIASLVERFGCSPITGGVAGKERVGGETVGRQCSGGTR